MRTRIILIISLSGGLAASCLVACGGASSVGDGRSSVLTSFYPLEEAAREVGGSHVDVTNLTPPGVEPHDIELSSHDLDQILDADVVLYLGSGFQSAVQDAVESRGESGVTVDLLSTIDVTLRPGTEGALVDPHVWLDPRLMERIVDSVAVALSRAAPAYRADFRANAMRYDDGLRRLDARYRAGLSHCATTVVVTTHAAFGYLSRRYGLQQEPITGIDPEVEPDPARLAEIEDLVRRDHVGTIFTETLVSPKVAETIARETHATTAVLDPLEGLTPQEAAAGEDFVSIMDRNLLALRTGLDCA